LLLFIAMAQINYYLGVVLLCLSLFFSVFYYIRLIRFLFFSENNKKVGFKFFYLELFIIIGFINMLSIFIFPTLVSYINILLLTFF